MTWHFAYGSNMSRAQMQVRCPGAIPAGAARLDGWRFIIMQGGYASVVPQRGAAVHGVLWRLSPRHLAALNAYETLHSGLYRRRVLPVRFGNSVVPALVYIGRTRSPGRAVVGYQDGIVVPAARNWKLPRAYIAKLARFAPGGWRARALREPGTIT